MLNHNPQPHSELRKKPSTRLNTVSPTWGGVLEQSTVRLGGWFKGGIRSKATLVPYPIWPFGTPGR